ncbi:MarR family winged helix-turn-helix transcriptional regulator [Massilia pseudoviolaceinigra]|uniref:MarR family winged helix-turn-helix transcriptional regulator n=1 Tax=Massilia pseudoviolaceinigra TaxID=3057165 RepID=UPI002796CD24|nr:MarR family winged helix-turn-helix transcriptional regulator [Massilia sp. CCM 9206]MDQ1921566.1 MarR family winged helix-turn-helix transcriptional regulator [Massilia sp. CCM 9206]
MSTKAMTDFGILLNVAFGTFKIQLHKRLAEKGFDDLGSSFGYVFRMLEAQPQSLKQVASALGITAQGALKVINDMVAKGYVERHDEPGDGRSKRLALTPRAVAAMAEAHRFHVQFERNLAAKFGADQVGVMRLILEHVHADASVDGMATVRPF